jgi:hypothetical protein
MFFGAVDRLEQACVENGKSEMLSRLVTYFEAHPKEMTPGLKQFVLEEREKILATVPKHLRT